SPSASSRSPRALRSFPTRRSSDLDLARRCFEHILAEEVRPLLLGQRGARARQVGRILDVSARDHRGSLRYAREPASDSRIILKRSEEHTSELQSREKLVCRLLLET